MKLKSCDSDFLPAFELASHRFSVKECDEAMSMDSAMDSLSTTSDHSIASSNDSMHNLRNRSPRSHNDSGHHHGSTSSRQNSHDKTRTPTPNSPQPPMMHHHRDSRSSFRSDVGGRRSRSPLVQHPMPPHPLSPPQVSTPSSLMGIQSRMAQNFSHLPPHGLGLLNSFMHHASPLDLMAAAHHQMPPRSYNSPPPISSSDPTANECKLVDYRGQKVAAFMIQGETMLCLPQAFELFLKHLVGGLHTVYTKLKRLDIVPLVCNVEQVRILRGLGAIQPGVNRCKLLSCKDFDVLYRDCTTARYVFGKSDKKKTALQMEHISVNLQLHFIAAMQFCCCCHDKMR